MIIPHHSLDKETFENLVREFVLREGTDYGEHESSLETKVSQVIAQIEAGKLVITYSEEYETCSIQSADNFK